MKKIYTLGLILLLAGGLALAGHHEKAQESDIVDTAVSAGSFNTLVAAVKAAGLVDALKGDGPLTVFAPTDEAFAKLPAGTVDTLLKPENRDKLVAILTYHVVPGAIYAKDVKPGRVETLQGSSFTVSKKGDGLFVDKARIVATDVKTSNGVIHVIDSVILPPEKTSQGMPEMGASKRLIETAIAHGVPAFNMGQHDACTAMYKIAAMSLVDYDSGLEDADRDRLRRAMTATEQTHSSSRRAWIMREALDDVYSSINDRMRLMQVTRR